MRQIVLDTETTGLDVHAGHRILEIGCVELRDRRLTGHHFHHYLQPDREIEAGALAVHGLTQEMLAAQPRFADIVERFLDYLSDADEVLIHNAPFDVGFIDSELTRLGDGFGRLSDYCTVVDTLELAKRDRPGQRNSLDALCKAFAVDNTGRTLHGALLDAQLLAEVYLAMTGGQSSLALGQLGEIEDPNPRRPLPTDRPPLIIRYADPEELAAHAQVLAVIDRACGGQCRWLH